MIDEMLMHNLFVSIVVFLTILCSRSCRCLQVSYEQECAAWTILLNSVNQSQVKSAQWA